MYSEKRASIVHLCICIFNLGFIDYMAQTLIIFVLKCCVVDTTTAAFGNHDDEVVDCNNDVIIIAVDCLNIACQSLIESI